MELFDLKIENNDLVFDGIGRVTSIEDAAVIVQNVRDRIRDSGLITSLIGERSETERQGIFQSIILIVEDDERILPGSVMIEELSSKKYQITMKDMEGNGYTTEL
jgi:DNA recombination-dependent growth factor C